MKFIATIILIFAVMSLWKLIAPDHFGTIVSPERMEAVYEMNRRSRN